MPIITNARLHSYGSDDSGWANIGPYLDGNDNLYVVAETNLADRLGVFKSDDDGATWAEVDDSNHPVIANNLALIAVFRLGTVLHIATQTYGFASGMNTAWNIRYHTFNMSDAGSNPDTWQTTNEDVVTPTASALATTGAAIGIAVRSDGDVIITHVGTDTAIMGNDFTRVSYSRKESGSWTTDIALDIASSDENYQFSPRCVLGTGDNLHIVWSVFGVGIAVVRAKTLDAANSLSTLITPYTTNQHVPFDPISYDRSGTQYILIIPRNNSTGDLQSRELEEDGSGDVSINLGIQTVSTSAFLTPNAGLVEDLASGDYWAAYRHSDGSLNTKEKSGAGAWANETERKSSAINNRSSFWQAYNRDGSDHLGYVYNDADGSPTDALWFDEITTGAAGQTIAVGTLAETDSLLTIAPLGTPVGTLAETNTLLPVSVFQPYHITDFLGIRAAYGTHANSVRQIGTDLFAMERTNSNERDLAIYKSTDDGQNWTQVAELTDVVSDGIHNIATTVASSDIYIITISATGEAMYHLFDPGTDTFTISKEIINDSNIGSTNRSVGVAVRSDGSVVAMFRTTSSPWVIRYAIRNGSWTGATALSADDGVDEIDSGACVLGANDRVHFFWHNHTDSTIYHRALNSSDVLQTEQLVTSPGASAVDLDSYGAGRYAKSGGVRVGYFYESSIRKWGVIHADSADAPTWTIDTDLPDNQAPDDGTAADVHLTGLVGNDTDEEFILGFQQTSPTDREVFFVRRPDGGTWTADKDTGLEALRISVSGANTSFGDFGLRVDGSVVYLNWWSVVTTSPFEDWLYQEVGLGVEVAIGTIAETNSLIPVGVSIYKTIGTLAEVNTLISVNVTQAGGQDIIVDTMAEVETLLAIPGAKIVAVGTLAELEVFQSIPAIHVVNIGTLLETDMLVLVGTIINASTDLFIAINLTDSAVLAQVQAAQGLGQPQSGDHIAKLYHPDRRIVRR